MSHSPYGTGTGGIEACPPDPGPMSWTKREKKGKKMNKKNSIAGNNVISIKVSDEFLEFMKMLCKDTGLSMTEHGRRALEQYANKMAERYYL